MASKAQKSEIFDNEGLPYQIFADTNDDLVQFDIVHKNLPIGLAKYWIRSPKNIELDDIYIFDEVFKPEPLWLVFIRCIFRRPQQGKITKEKA